MLHVFLIISLCVCYMHVFLIISLKTKFTGSTASPVTNAIIQGKDFYQEIWFIILLILIAILLMFLIVAFCLKQIGSRRPYIRERSPLNPSQRKLSQPYTFSSSDDSGIFETVSIYLFRFINTCHLV